VAESTGKHGKGALPIVDEPLGDPAEYGDDRAFVAVSTDRDAPDADKLSALENAGHPILRLSTRVDGLGAEFFRWEFATAVAGAALGINPFDEPNVSEAKAKTKALLEAFAASGALAAPPAAAEDAAVAVYSRAFRGDTPALDVLVQAVAVRVHRDDGREVLDELEVPHRLGRAELEQRHAVHPFDAARVELRGAADRVQVDGAVLLQRRPASSAPCRPCRSRRARRSADDVGLVGLLADAGGGAGRRVTVHAVPVFFTTGPQW
jgi:hypothetical protein